jgi:XTP/dITP diphosphohydrolase
VRVVLASANAGKLRELTALVAPLGVELITQASLGIESPPETCATFLDNALIKARHAARASGLAALADDSGIEVDALGGRPGVRSARFAGEGASDAQNLRKLLRELRSVPESQRTARYRCSVVFVRGPDDARPVVAQGIWEGRIVTGPRGSGGFGYDPVFVPTGLASTAAELAADVKNSLSHRGQALRSLVAQLAAALNDERGQGK